MRKAFTASIFLLVACAFAQDASQINPLLGTEGGGNTFPGPSLPFGMVKPGPDMGNNTGNAGWLPHADINGFSQTHVSGTGGGDKYGNILVQPTVGAAQATGFSSPAAVEIATAGFYHVTLTRAPIDVDITAARRTALYRFIYPATGSRNLLFDVGHVLSAYAENGEGQTVLHSHARVLSPSEISGFSEVTGGWNQQTTSYTVFFYAVTDTPAGSWGTWHGAQLHPGSDEQIGGSGESVGAWLTLRDRGTRTVRLKVGISFVSEAQARANAVSEIAGFAFDATHAAAIAAWNRALAPITVGGASKEELGIFATALYHSMLMPVDRTGENPLWQSSEPYFDDFYTIWDTFRTSSPLLTLIAPDRQAAIVRSLVDIYRHTGWLPDGRTGNFNGRTQGGSDAEFVLTDAYLKGLPGVNWSTAYRGMLKDAEVPPPNQIMEGRGGLSDWKSLGYVSVEGVDRPGSKQMEYAADDFEIYLLARALGHASDAAKYLARSQSWEKLWDTAASDAGFKGFIWPRHRDGSWKADFNALQTGSWNGDTFYEGNSWTYSTFVPQDVRRLVALSGGDDVFVHRLDAFFTGNDRYAVGNEPGFLSPYLYLWAGRQDRTADQIRRILAANYRAGRSGLPGNDDSGAMSSWYAFGKLGFFPNAGQDVYLLGSPAFPKVTLHLSNGNTFTVEARNVSDADRYIARAEWNGRPFTQSWFRHADLLRGGRLVLTMSSTPSAWFTGPPPPSASDGPSGTH